MSTNATYIVSSINASISNINGEDLYTINLIDVDTDERYKTYIQPTNRNFRKWKLIIDNSADGWVIEGLRIQNKNKNIINDDSNINVINRITQGADELLQAYYDDK